MRGLYCPSRHPGPSIAGIVGPLRIGSVFLIGGGDDALAARSQAGLIAPAIDEPTAGDNYCGLPVDVVVSLANGWAANFGTE